MFSLEEMFAANALQVHYQGKHFISSSPMPFLIRVSLQEDSQLEELFSVLEISRAQRHPDFSMLQILDKCLKAWLWFLLDHSSRFDSTNRRQCFMLLWLRKRIYMIQDISRLRN